MLKVEIKSAEINEKSGISQKTGKPYTIRDQIGYVSLKGKPYPVEFRFVVEAAGYPVGNYFFEPEIYIGGYGQLQLGKNVLLVSQSNVKAA